MSGVVWDIFLIGINKEVEHVVVCETIFSTHIVSDLTFSKELTCGVQIQHDYVIPILIS